MANQGTQREQSFHRLRTPHALPERHVRAKHYQHIHATRLQCLEKRNSKKMIIYSYTLGPNDIYEKTGVKVLHYPRF